MAASPLLNTGHTFAFFHKVGNTPSRIDLLNIWHRGSASSKKRSHKKWLFIWSVPTASDWSIFHISPVLGSMSVRCSLKLYTGGKEPSWLLFSSLVCTTKTSLLFLVQSNSIRTPTYILVCDKTQVLMFYFFNLELYIFKSILFDECLVNILPLHDWTLILFNKHITNTRINLSPIKILHFRCNYTNWFNRKKHYNLKYVYIIYELLLSFYLSNIVLFHNTLIRLKILYEKSGQTGTRFWSE